MKKIKESDILFCSFNDEISAGKLKRVLELHFPKDMIIHLKTMDEFITCVTHPLPGNLVLILLCAAKDELSQVMLYRNLLLRHRIILILPDSEPETLSQGHTLRPRFTTFIDEDMIELSAVLSRMFQSTKQRRMADIC